MDAIHMLLNRASALKLSDPGPTEEQLQLILQAAVRAPDHGRLRPWAFVVVPRTQREQFGDDRVCGGPARRRGFRSVLVVPCMI